MTQNVLETHKLSKRYKKKTVVDEVSMTLKRGEIYGLVGKNGAGKTTFLRLVTGLAFPDDGALMLFGESSPAALSRGRKRLGAIVEAASFYPFLTVAQNLEYYRRLRGIPDKGKVKEVLLAVGLEEAAKKKYKHLSLGMKQRLGLALALLGEPDLLILDEPTNGLDPTGIVAFRNMLLKLNQERDLTILISSHILSELSNMATRYGFIDQGRLIEELTAQELADRCRAYLELVVDDAPGAAVVLETQLDCVNYEIHPEGSIRVYGLFDKRDRLSAALTQRGIGLLSMAVKGSNLEDYFVHLVGGDKNAERH
ncbi:MAG: ABC transporter ATP-binding protein [Eubacterium sp.]|nr:ABC transporter ATP-binding protein [Eubacterium sp.]